jgi:hypothetical protein
MLSAIMLSAVMLSAVMLNAVMLNVRHYFTLDFWREVKISLFKSQVLQVLYVKATRCIFACLLDLNFKQMKLARKHSLLNTQAYFG